MVSGLGKSGGLTIGEKTQLCKRRFGKVFTCSRQLDKIMRLTSQVLLVEADSSDRAHKLHRCQSFLSATLNVLPDEPQRLKAVRSVRSRASSKIILAHGEKVRSTRPPRQSLLLQ